MMEAVREWVWNYGMDHPEQEWLLSDYDTWHHNPHYTGPATPRPDEEDWDVFHCVGD